MQPYYYPQTSTQTRQQTFMGLKGRPVTGLEEVRAAAVDFDGSISFFPDLANGKIYTKQCNIDGTAALNMYELKEIPAAVDPQNLSAYVTRDEFNSALSALRDALIKTNNVEASPDQTQSSHTSIKEFKF